MRRLLLLLTLFAASGRAADQWTRVTTPHFELYTTAGEKKGRELILYFEQVRSFFTQSTPSKNGYDFPIRIVVFRSEKQYRPYSPNSAAAAYYTQGRYRDYIVMSDADTEHLPVAIHEFMHLVINHAGVKLPVWLNEGWADLYSTLKPKGSKAMVGDLIPGRVQVLQTEKWLSWDALTSVGLKSETYNEKDRAGIFYAESWALVHMLYLTPEYGGKFANFVLAVSRGQTAAQACQTVYGRSSEKVYADLQSYLRRNQLFGALIDVKLTKSEEDPEVSQVALFESETVLADLLSVAGKRDQAAEAFRKLEAENPGKPEIAQSMGYLAWQNNDRNGARAQFEKAFDAGGNDPEMCFHLAMLELEQSQTSDRALAALQRAVGVKPDYTDARFQLGLVEMNRHEYEGAIAAFGWIHKIDDEHAATLFNALAYAYLQVKNYDEARKQAVLALKWDKTDFDKQRSEQVIRYLDQIDRKDHPVAPAQMSEIQDERPHLARRDEPEAEKTERVEGTAKTFDCDAKRFVMEVDGKAFAFDLPDPSKIRLRHEGSDTFEFTCGPQKPFHVAVEYVPAAKADGELKGSLRVLEF
jgi:tetratricopeptide (TPR) repeat protein